MRNVKSIGCAPHLHRPVRQGRGTARKPRVLALCLTLAVLCAAGTPVRAQADAAPPKGVSKLTLDAENCNIRLSLSADGQFHYEYDDDTFLLATTEKDAEKTITVRKNGGDTAPLETAGRAGTAVRSTTKDEDSGGWRTEFVSIQIPQNAYEQLQFNLKEAGIGVPAINCDINIEAQQSAVSAAVPKGFDKTLSYHGTECSGSISLQSGVTDVTVAMQSPDSAVAVPDGWPRFIPSQPYTYQLGRAAGQIRINLSGCAFSLSKQ